MRLPVGEVIIRTCHISIHPKPGFISTNCPQHKHLQFHTLLIDTSKSSVCALSQSDSIVQTLQLWSCSFITLTHTSTAIMINVDLQTKDRSKYLHTNTMFHKCSTHEVRDTDLIFLVLTHTLCSCEPNQSPWQPQSMFPLGGVMVGVQDTEAIQNERKRQIEREQCAYLKRWARSQNNSSINRAGGMMPHLHTHLHTHNQAPQTDQVENLLSYAFPHTI